MCFNLLCKVLLYYNPHHFFDKPPRLVASALQCVLCSMLWMYYVSHSRKSGIQHGLQSWTTGLEISYLHHLSWYAALHELDPVFKKFSFSESVASLFSSLGYKRPAVIQSMYIFKVDFLAFTFCWHCMLFRNFLLFFYSNQVLVVRWCRTRIIHSFTRNLEHAQGCGLHLKMQQSTMVACGQFQDHIKVFLSHNYFMPKNVLKGRNI